MLLDRLITDGFAVPFDAAEDSTEYLRNIDAVVSNELKLLILPTYKCNFRCTYCYQDFTMATMNEDSIKKIVKYVKKEIHKYSGLSVGWYGGEPLLCLQVIDRLSKELIKICHSVNRKYTAAITTNGYLLTEKIFSKMLENHITLYQVTLDGLASIHDQDRKLINGNGSFDTIVNNLKAISRNRSGAFRLQIRCNMQPDRIKEYEEYLKFLYENFGNDHRYRYWFTAVSNYGGTAIKQLQSLFGSFDDIYDMLISSEYYLDYSPFYYHLISRGCISSSRNTYVIAPDCTIMKCTVGLDKDENKVGYITEKGEAIIDYYKLSKWIHYKRHPQSRCANCERGNICVNFACPKVNNFPDEGIDCTRNYVNTEKIVRLLSRGNYSFIKQY